MLCGCSTAQELQPEPMVLGGSFQRLQTSLEQSLGARLDRIEACLACIERSMCRGSEMKYQNKPTATSITGTATEDKLEELSAELDKESLGVNRNEPSSLSKALDRQPGDECTEDKLVEGAFLEDPPKLGNDVIEEPPTPLSDSVGVSGRVNKTVSFSVCEALLNELGHAELSRWDMDVEGFSTSSKLFVESSNKEVAGENDHKAVCRLRPSSPVRLQWDVMGMGMIIYDLMFIPLDLAFELPQSGVLTAMFWITLLFWTLDVPITFVSGYYINGTEEMRLSRIASNYLRTWFLLDVGIIGLDWFTVFAKQERQGGIAIMRMGKSLRFLRILRAARLLRLAKLRKILEIIQDNLHTEYSHVIANMMKLVLMILTINHCIACAWYALSVSISDTENAWINEVKGDHGQIFFYLSSMHWSLTQFTPASMEIFPRNSKERFFAVTVLLFALLVFSSFLSSITAAMTQLRQMSSIGDKNVSVLRRYLRSRDVDASLSIRILRYVEYKLSVQKNTIQESDVRLLKMISKPLQKELITETYAPVLCEHPYFAIMKTVSAAAIREVCNLAISSLSLSEGDTVFTSGSADDNMIFVTEGRLLYLTTTRRDSVSNAQVLPMATGSDSDITGSVPSGQLKLVPTLKVKILSLQGLHIEEGEAAYCSCELVGKKDGVFRTDAVSATPHLDWNHSDNLVGYVVGDKIAFHIWLERDGEKDELIVSATVPSQFLREPCFEGDLMMELADTGTIAYLTVRIERCEYGELAHRSKSSSNGLVVCHLDSGEWCCESSLWTSWVHQGTLVADTFSQTSLLHAQPLIDVIKQNRMVAQPTKKYAQLFVEALNEQYSDGVLTDVELQLVSISARLASSLSWGERSSRSSPAIRRACPPPAML
eukprot:TRINITY_DN5351_c0_g2_i1.p1 TRINITY_DN5351_c0_g2~~TRINITY_DN5351_c0_g2_i1.p1  ORF type:complete len:883 (-),score=104.79 TRINITY_DN5351_c0_g2_i1:86-2734(-)